MTNLELMRESANVIDLRDVIMLNDFAPYALAAVAVCALVPPSHVGYRRGWPWRIGLTALAWLALDFVIG